MSFRPGLAASLRLFDPSAGLFQRARVAGQLLHRSGRELFLAGEGAGFRAWLKTEPAGLEPGELVEVVGFPDLAVRGCPVLRQARVRSVGRTALPEPRPLPEQDWDPAELDARRVRCEGVVVEQRRTERGWLFELQRGLRWLAVRWDRPDAPPDVAVGSRVSLTGVCAVTPTGPEEAAEAGSFQIPWLARPTRYECWRDRRFGRWSGCWGWWGC